jgi:hypothetical protein
MTEQQAEATLRTTAEMTEDEIEFRATHESDVAVMSMRQTREVLLLKARGANKDIPADTPGMLTDEEIELKRGHTKDFIALRLRANRDLAKLKLRQAGKGG